MKQIQQSYLKSVGGKYNKILPHFKTSADFWQINIGSLMFWDVIFIQRFVCILSPTLGEGIENTTVG
jgi:hypothetical protein